MLTSFDQWYKFREVTTHLILRLPVVIKSGLMLKLMIEVVLGFHVSQSEIVAFFVTGLVNRSGETP